MTNINEILIAIAGNKELQIFQKGGWIPLSHDEALYRIYTKSKDEIRVKPATIRIGEAEIGIPTKGAEKGTVLFFWNGIDISKFYFDPENETHEKLIKNSWVFDSEEKVEAFIIAWKNLNKGVG